MQLLLDTVNKRKESYNDSEIELGRLNFADFTDGLFYFTDIHTNITHELSDLASRQLYGLLGIPFDYIKKCGHFLIKSNTSFWTGELWHKNILIRFSNNLVRGILSDRYNTTYDDAVTVPIIASSLDTLYNEESFNLNVDFNIDNNLTWISLSSLKDQVTYNNLVFTPGIEITNSEVGILSFRIRPYINFHRSDLYQHKVITSLSRSGLTKISHLKQLDLPSLEAIIHQGIKNAHEAAFLGIKEAIELSKEPVSNPKEELEKIGKECNFLGKRIQHMIYEEKSYDKREVTKLELISDILETMKEADMYKRIILQEKLGSHFGLFKKTQETKSQIINAAKKDEVDFRFNLDF